MLVSHRNNAAVNKETNSFVNRRIKSFIRKLTSMFGSATNGMDLTPNQWAGKIK